jgi:hypothetical protein
MFHHIYHIFYQLYLNLSEYLFFFGVFQEDKQTLFFLLFQFVSTGPTVSSGQTVSTGPTVSSGQTVSSGPTVSSGQTVSSGPSGPTVSSGPIGSNDSSL